MTRKINNNNDKIVTCKGITGINHSASIAGK